MTDEQIIEKVTKNLNRSKCLEPFEARDIVEQKDAIIAELIEENNWQKAELRKYETKVAQATELLQHTYQDVKETESLVSNKIKEAKIEAYEEFAERLKEKLYWVRREFIVRRISVKDIQRVVDNLVKEMKKNVLKVSPKAEVTDKRTLDNCKLIEKTGNKPPQYGGKCEGYAKSDYDDEPCEYCKLCDLNVYYEE